jgi:DNA-directed RNA polymerase subunit F
MKWLKKFEELSPELIRRAGNKLISKGHSERGLDLLDKSYLGNTPFNVWITDNGNWLKRLPKEDKDRSEPLPLSYNFSSSKFYFYPRNSTYELGGQEMDAEGLVDFWEQGKCDLGFNIDFHFKPTKETIKSVKFEKGHFDREVPLFNINFLIHRKINDRDNSVLVTKLSKDSVYMQKYFSEIYKEEPKITLSYPNAKNLPSKTYGGDNEYGLFSDRKSALNFKNNILTKEMDQHTDKIMDILSILNMKSDKVEEILNFYKRVTLNYLYRSEIPHYVNSAADTEKYFFGYENDIRS